jgi:hypothetical protein
MPESDKEKKKAVKKLRKVSVDGLINDDDFGKYFNQSDLKLLKLLFELVNEINRNFTRDLYQPMAIIGRTTLEYH